MLTTVDRQIAREFQRRLVTFAPVRELYVFGSRVTGQATAESDLDLFIEMETLTPELRQRIFELAWEVGFEEDRVISTIVTTAEELEHGAMGANPLLFRVQREGVRL